MTPAISLEARLRRIASRTVRPLQFRLRRAWLHVVDSFVLFAAAAPDEDRVLLIRLDNIGDFIIWLDAARALTEHLKAQGKHVTLLASASWASLAEDTGLFDEVMPLDQGAFKHKLAYRRRLLRKVRAKRLGTVIQPTVTRVPEMGDAVVRVSGATERIGVALPHEIVSAARTSKSSSRYTRLIAPGTSAHGEMQANAHVVRALTGTEYQARIASLPHAVHNASLGGFAQLIPASPYVVLFPGASAAGRQWPVQHFVALAQRCIEQSPLKVLVCGGPGDVRVAQEIADAAGAGVTSLAGKTSLKQLASVIAGAHLLVSNETSAVHMAAAVGVPSVCIVGGGHFGRFLPYDVQPEPNRPIPVVASRAMECFGCNWTCKFHPARNKPMPCIEGISIDTVWQLTHSLLMPTVQEVQA